MGVQIRDGISREIGNLVKGHERLERGRLKDRNVFHEQLSTSYNRIPEYYVLLPRYLTILVGTELGLLSHTFDSYE